MVLTCSASVAGASGAPALMPSTAPCPTTSMPQASTIPGASTGGPSEEPIVQPSVPPQTGPDLGAGGDVPDNAVFLTYIDSAHRFSIDYVEGWQVTPTATGVRIADKDSSETVDVLPPVADIAAWIAGTDLPGLEAQPGYALDARDRVQLTGAVFEHVRFHLLSPPDPVTGKQVPSTADRYYVPGPCGLAVVTLATPDGVDNVDAFLTMAESFAWS
jgi:hypothetical protein